MAVTKKVASKRSHERAATRPQAFYRLNSLLNSMRRIMQHDDELCTLMHEIKQAGVISPDVAKELGELLDRLPGQHYLDDLTAVRKLLEVRSPRPSRNKATAGKKTAKTSRATKNAEI